MFSDIRNNEKTHFARIHSEAFQTRVKNLISATDEPDTLYKKIEVLAKKKKTVQLQILCCPCCQRTWD
ncbi:hypothetical protein XELAEV_18039530mg [Xenopus laevis]|uniref:Uncharacterized protein n=1 Tax=Xenopus laevis TaxID=8355 RepID=A0A974C7Z1_XENLA|nr:hypothetical protein XELAEV_18039530mg [Xenopus laevis]